MRHSADQIVLANGADRAGYTAILAPVLALLLSSYVEDYRWSLFAIAGLALVAAGNVLVLTGKRGTAVVAVAFGVAVALAAVLIYAGTGTGDSADFAWKQSGAVPSTLPPGPTVVDAAIPVEVVPEVQASAVACGCSGHRARSDCGHGNI